MTAARVTAFVLAALAAAGCGYALTGRGISIPDHIRVISVPPFQNLSSTPEVDQVITTAVQQEFQGRGRFRTISDDTGGDAILRGAISNVRSEAIAFDPVSQQATRLVIVVTMNVEFVDLKDNKKVLWSRNGWRAQEEYDISAGVIVSDPSALFRQDTNAMFRLAKTVSRSLVTSILDAF